MSYDISEFETPEKRDFRRANGAPLIIDKDGKQQRFSRPSGWGKILDDENALVNWKLDVAIQGTARDKALQAQIIAVKDDDRAAKADLREAAIRAGRGSEASDIGTALHAMSERWEQEDDFDPGPHRESLEAYSAELDRLGLVSELFEYHAVNVEYRAAGTADRLYRLTKPLVTPKGEVLPAGELLVGDLKTGKKLDFSLPGYCVQMALYAQAEMYDVIHDQFRPTPSINQDWGLLVHMPADGDLAGTCQILWCDLEVGNYGAYLVREVREWRSKWKSGKYAAPVVESPLDGEVVQAGDVEWVEMMLPFVRERVQRLRDNPEATQQLLISWPENVPPPKKIEEHEHVTLALDLLDRIEARYGLSWPEGDPRHTTGRHKDAGPVSNTYEGVSES